MSITRILLFLSVVTLVMGGGSYYLWRRLGRDPQWPAPWQRWGTRILWGAMLVMLASMMGMRYLPRQWGSPLAWFSYSWMGYLWLVLVLVVFGELARAIYRAIAFARRKPMDANRRQFFARAIASFAGAGAAGLAAGGMHEVLSQIKVKGVDVFLEKLPVGQDGYSIVQLTDVHVGPTIGRDYIQAVVDRANALAPDVIVITGDLVDGTVENLGEHVAPLGQLRAREGVYFVTGNHEYFSGVDPWLAFLTGLGIRVLRNERMELSAIDLAGVDDISAARYGEGHGEDIARAVAQRRGDMPLVLLAHQPIAVTRAASHGVELQLSGHTHGGQIYPWSWLVKLQQPYVAGLHRHQATQLYVSSGTGYWGPPMRVGTSAEITHVRLYRGGHEQSGHPNLG